MKTIRVVIIVCLCAMALTILAGCNNPSSYVFSFSYSINDDDIIRGEKIEISVELINSSNRKYSYKGAESDYRAIPKLFCIDGETEYLIPADPIPSTTDFGNHIINAHESKTYTFYYLIPLDAPSGEYNLKVSYLDSSDIYTNIFTLED